MKIESDVKSSAKARFNQTKKHAKYIHEGLNGITFDQFTDVHMADLRAAAEKLHQCVHELNAYRNVLRTPVAKSPRPPRAPRVVKPNIGDRVKFLKYRDDATEGVFSPDDVLVVVDRFMDGDNEMIYACVKEDDYDLYQRVPDAVDGNELYRNEFEIITKGK
jgi:hypothetical protein